MVIVPSEPPQVVGSVKDDAVPDGALGSINEAGPAKVVEHPAAFVTTKVV